MERVKVLILGGGPAGISAAIWCKRLELSHLLIESQDELGGQLHEIKNSIIDYPGIIASNGLEVKRSFIQHANSLSCNFLLESKCTRVNFIDHIAVIDEKILNQKRKIKFDFLIIASGASQRKLGIPGEQEMINRGEVYSTNCDSYLFKNREIAIIGGGDRAVEGANNLAEYGAFVHLINRSTEFRSRSELLKPALSHPNIEVYLDAKVNKIFDDGEKVTCISMLKQGIPYKIQVSGVLIRIGIKPNSGLVKKEVLLDNNGYIIVNEYGQTNLPNVFAIGDVCNSPAFSSIASSVGQGMRAVKRIVKQS